MNHDEQRHAFIDHLLLEHRRLHRTLHGIKHDWESLAIARNWLDLKQRLEGLRAELVRHFAEEESGGCLEEAVSHCPSIGPQVDEVLAEHAGLLRQFEGILTRCNDRLTPTDAAQLRDEFEQFSRQFVAHEATEARILQQGFGTNLEEELVEG